METSSFLSPAPDNNPAPFLFSEEALEKLDGLEKEAALRGEWTGERLRREAPRLVEGVLRLAALEVMTKEDIAFALGMSVNSVRAILTEGATAVDGYKERLGKGLRTVTMLTVAALTKKLQDPYAVAKMKVGELAVVAGITIEKEQLVSGGATQRIEHTVAAPPIDAFNEYIASLPSAHATPIEMGCGAGEMLQKGEIARLVDGAAEGVILPTADMESAALQAEKAYDTGCASDQAPPKGDPA